MKASARPTIRAIVDMANALGLGIDDCDFLFTGDLIVALPGLVASQRLAVRTVLLAHVAFDLFLLLGQLLGLAHQIFHLILGLGGANSGERLLRVLKGGLRATRVGLSLRRAGLLAGGRLAHAVDGLLQVVQGVLQLPLIAHAGAHLA